MSCMPDQTVVESLRRKYAALRSAMDERTRRRWAAAEAMELGWGGITAVARATSLSRTTITEGVRELKSGTKNPAQEGLSRIRRPGAGRKPLIETDPRPESRLLKNWSIPSRVATHSRRCAGR